MSDSSNLTTERATFVTHLEECAMTGERHEPDRLHTDCRPRAIPLLVRYDLEAIGRARRSRCSSSGAPATSGAIARSCRSATRHGLSCRWVSQMTPLVTLPHLHDGQSLPLVKDEGGGCRRARSRRAGWRVAVSMAKELGVRRCRDSDQWQCRRGACRLCARGLASRLTSSAPTTPRR